MCGVAPDVSGEKYSPRAPLGIDAKDTHRKSTWFIPHPPLGFLVFACDETPEL